MNDRSHSSPRAEYRESTPRWWLILWIVWGAIIAALILWFDRNWLAAAAWLAAGSAVGALGTKVLPPWAGPVWDWYRGFWQDADREERLWQLNMRVLDRIDDEPHLAERALSEGTESRLFEEILGKADFAEYERLTVEESGDAFLWMPLFVGLFHGTLGGGVVGALAPLDPDVTIAAWQAAALGTIMGSVIVSFLASLMFSLWVPIRKELPLVTRVWRRALVAASPLLVVPLTWHCLRYSAHRHASRF